METEKLKTDLESEGTMETRTKNFKQQGFFIFTLQEKYTGKCKLINPSTGCLLTPAPPHDKNIYIIL